MVNNPTYINNTQVCIRIFTPLISYPCIMTLIKDSSEFNWSIDLFGIFIIEINFLSYNLFYTFLFWKWE